MSAVRQGRGRRKCDSLGKVLQGFLEAVSSIAADVIDKGPIGSLGIRRRAPRQDLGDFSFEPRRPAQQGGKRRQDIAAGSHASALQGAETFDRIRGLQTEDKRSANAFGFEQPGEGRLTALFI